MNTLHIMIITGLSGSGKSTAMSALEDAGYYCVDNMPVLLLPKFLELPLNISTDITGLGFAMDLREKEFINTYPEVFKDLSRKGYDFRIVFLEADEQVLVRRFSQTRRQHPLHSGTQLIDSIRKEKDLLFDLRKRADKIIDTSRYDTNTLKSVIKGLASKNSTETMKINVMSFGFKYGLPSESDLVMDVRFLKNPYFVPELKDFSGLNPDVRSYVMENEDTPTFLNQFLFLVDYLIPLYKREGKSYLTISIGCTGGRHRSVVISSILFEHLSKTENNVTLTHRDMGLEEPEH